ncbi:hypothetical protein BDW68DRAFT_195610 [Aspergillus falconensis]
MSIRFRFKTKYKGHPVQRGTGVWGHELDHGPLFLIEELHVAALELRQKGLGWKIVSLLLNKAKQLSLDEKGDGEDQDLVYSSNEAFEQAWTLHALLHQSRALGTASNFDLCRDDAGDLEDKELYETATFTEVKKIKMERLCDALLLHHAALTLGDNELKAFFMTHTDDNIGWARVTTSEATLLHLTACELKPLSTQWLLESVPNADSWKMAQDINGYTPLEALQENLETMQTQKEVGSRVLNLSDHFRGYPDTAVSYLPLLSRLDTLGLNDECLQYRCTCREYLEGFLSTQMRSTLDEIDDGSFWVKDNNYILVHLNPNIQKNLKTNKSLRKDFEKRWPPDTKNYLQRAGTQMGCWAVLQYMFNTAKEEDEKAGDGQCQLILKEEWSNLPTCRNDHEFEFVARACGYGGDDFISLPCW